MYSDNNTYVCTCTGGEGMVPGVTDPGITGRHEGWLDLSGAIDRG